jgi:hypothetical protein
MKGGTNNAAKKHPPLQSRSDVPLAQARPRDHRVRAFDSRRGTPLGVSFFAVLKRAYFTIRTLALQPTPDGPSVEQKLRNLRSGYVPAVGFALFMGSAVSVLAEHPLPLLAAAGTSVLMIAAYESALPANVRFQLLSGQQQPTSLLAGWDASLPPGSVVDVAPRSTWSL